MSKKTNTSNKGNNTDSNKRGYKPGEGGSVTGGHKPEKSQKKPVKPPKRK